MISHKYKCIFIHIPRCAGTSVDVALSTEPLVYTNLLDKPLLFAFLLGKSFIANLLGKPLLYWDSKNKMWLQHTTAKNIREIYISKKKFKDYFKFTIVRNPFDRIVSSYNWLCGNNNITKNDLTFKDFILMQGKFKDLLDKNKQSEKKNRYHQIMPMVDYLFDKDELLVDFVGRFENFNEDWKEICNKLKFKIKLPHLNKRSHRHYRSYYNEFTKKIIQNRYKKDLKLFNYDF